MANRKQTKIFTINGVVKMEVSIDIEAEDYTQAFERAKSFTELDFVKPLGDYIDGEYMGVSSIWSREPSKI